MTMQPQQLAVQLSIQEVYDCVCPECQKQIKALVRDKISDQMVDQVIKGTKTPETPGSGDSGGR
jgi:hypothetical protein